MKGGMKSTSKFPRSSHKPFRTRTQYLGGVALALGLGLVELALAQDPIITLQPTNQTVLVGGNVMMSVQATSTNGPLTYQWQRDDPAVPVTFTNIPNATRVRLDLRNVTLEAAGDYRVIVGNAGGDTVTSDVAHLEVILPLFTKVTEGPHVTDLGSSGFGGWADYDNDGHADLLVQRYASSTDALYRNNGDGTFSRIPKPPGLAATEDHYTARYCDSDNDGNQDLFVMIGEARYIAYGDGDWDFSPEYLTDVRPGRPVVADYDRDGLLDAYRTWGNGLDHSLGNREFVTYFGTQDLGPLGHYTFGWACCGDFDDDGWPDLFVASLDESRSYLFRNDGNGGFTAVDNLVTQTRAPSLSGAWGDYDNDDRLDLFVAAFNGTSTLYRNLGNGEFERPEGAPTLNGIHNHAYWIDYDNDGFLDLWVSGGWTANKLFRNNGDGSFTQVTTESIVTERPLNNGWTYQVAWFDYNNDGFLDAYVMNGDDNTSIQTANQFFRNNGNGNAWLTVRPVGTVSNRDGIGAKVRVLATYAGTARWQRRDINGGDTGNGNGRYAHFGLGDATKVDTLRIEWPSGTVQEQRNVATNQILTVTEPPRLIPQGVGKFQIQCWVGQTFDVQCSADLATWTTAAIVTNTTGTLIFEDVEADQHNCRYYRVLAE
jgi:enediyne biosynthesis protein E4